ncbi:MAG: flagellar assembly peptidoglycan hydrolase FlgJ [Pseudomonadota bacterium]
MRLPSTQPLSLDRPAGADRPGIEKAARELETQFAHMLIKSMRATTGGDPLGGNNTTYREMYDQQLAKELTRGRGLGIAPMVVRQLERSLSPAPAAIPAGGLPLAPPGAGFAMAQPVASPGMPLPQPLQLAPSSSGVSMSAAAPPDFNPPASSPSPSDADCGPATPLDCSSPEAFVKSLWPHAKKTAEQLGVPARALIAQAALETGWGRRLVGGDRGVTSHNLFGIKATGWNGAKVASGTHEYVGGVRVNMRDSFRAYASAAESFADYARLLGRSRYAGVRGTGEDVHGFASALQRSGYATDPSYANKITAIANGATMRRALAALERG